MSPDTTSAGAKARTWRPTQAYLRSCALGVSLLLAAVLLHDPGLTVLATPFLVITVWSLLTRPRSIPAVRYPVALPAIREGEAIRWQVELDAVPQLDLAALVLERPNHYQLRPLNGAVLAQPVAFSAEQSDGRRSPAIHLEVLARSSRWGHERVGRSLVGAVSRWGAFRWGPLEIASLDQTTLPLPAVFDAAAPTPHPVGLVGLNRSARAGEGSEFATIRPFQPGDRLRRIHWPVSLRSRTIHVTSTWSDQDAEILLLADASADLGTSEGIDGHASSLDVTVRAAGAMAEHFLRHGDRVGLCVFGRGVMRMPAGAGQAHLRRLLHRLADTKVGNQEATLDALQKLRLSAGTTVVMLSACVSRLALTYAASLAARGLSIVVVDTLPESIGGIEDVALTVAWRIRRLERDIELRELSRRGVPVVQWRGPGSLDVVLRDLARRDSAPRMAHR